MSRFPGEGEIFFNLPRPALGPTHFSVQRALLLLCPRKKRHVFEDFHFPNLVPRLRLRGVINRLLRTPWWCVQGNFAFTFLVRQFSILR